MYAFSLNAYNDKCKCYKSQNLRCTRRYIFQKNKSTIINDQILDETSLEFLPTCSKMLQIEQNSEILLRMTLLNL